MYVKGRALGSIHVDLPVVEICLICQFHFGAFGRGFDKLGQLLHIVVSINKISIRCILLLTFAIRFWLPIIAAVIRWRTTMRGAEVREGDQKRRRKRERNYLIKRSKQASSREPIQFIGTEH